MTNHHLNDKRGAPPQLITLNTYSTLAMSSRDQEMVQTLLLPSLNPFLDIPIACTYKTHPSMRNTNNYSMIKLNTFG